MASVNCCTFSALSGDPSVVRRYASVGWAAPAANALLRSACACADSVSCGKPELKS
jgi:hypothetical protein